MASGPSLSVIVPAFKEAENLPLLVPQIAAALGSHGWIWELIIPTPQATLQRTLAKPQGSAAA
jgi:hypothetical protein